MQADARTRARIIFNYGLEKLDRAQYVFEGRLHLIEEALGRDEDYVEKSFGASDSGQHVHLLLAAVGRSRIEGIEERRLAVYLDRAAFAADAGVWIGLLQPPDELLGVAIQIDRAR